MNDEWKAKDEELDNLLFQTALNDQSKTNQIFQNGKDHQKMIEGVDEKETWKLEDDFANQFYSTQTPTPKPESMSLGNTETPRNEYSEMEYKIYQNAQRNFANSKASFNISVVNQMDQTRKEAILSLKQNKFLVTIPPRNKIGSKFFGPHSINIEKIQGDQDHLLKLYLEKNQHVIIQALDFHQQLEILKTFQLFQFYNYSSSIFQIYASILGEKMEKEALVMKFTQQNSAQFEIQFQTVSTGVVVGNLLMQNGNAKIINFEKNINISFALSLKDPVILMSKKNELKMRLSFQDRNNQPVDIYCLTRTQRDLLIECFDHFKKNIEFSQNENFSFQNLTSIPETQITPQKSFSIISMASPQHLMTGSFRTTSSFSNAFLRSNLNIEQFSQISNEPNLSFEKINEQITEKPSVKPTDLISNRYELERHFTQFYTYTHFTKNGEGMIIQKKTHLPLSDDSAWKSPVLQTENLFQKKIIEKKTHRNLLRKSAKFKIKVVGEQSYPATIKISESALIFYAGKDRESQSKVLEIAYDDEHFFLDTTCLNRVLLRYKSSFILFLMKSALERDVFMNTYLIMSNKKFVRELVNLKKIQNPNFVLVGTTTITDFNAINNSFGEETDEEEAAPSQYEYKKNSKALKDFWKDAFSHKSYLLESNITKYSYDVYDSLMNVASKVHIILENTHFTIQINNTLIKRRYSQYSMLVDTEENQLNCRFDLDEKNYIFLKFNNYEEKLGFSLDLENKKRKSASFFRIWSSRIPQSISQDCYIYISGGKFPARIALEFDRLMIYYHKYETKSQEIEIQKTVHFADQEEQDEEVLLLTYTPSMSIKISQKHKEVAYLKLGFGLFVMLKLESPEESFELRSEFKKIRDNYLSYPIREKRCTNNISQMKCRYTVTLVDEETKNSEKKEIKLIPNFLLIPEKNNLFKRLKLRNLHAVIPQTSIDTLILEMRPSFGKYRLKLIFQETEDRAQFVENMSLFTSRTQFQKLLDDTLFEHHIFPISFIEKNSKFSYQATLILNEKNHDLTFQWPNSIFKKVFDLDQFEVFVDYQDSCNLHLISEEQKYLIIFQNQQHRIDFVRLFQKQKLLGDKKSEIEDDQLETSRDASLDLRSNLSFRYPKFAIRSFHQSKQEKASPNFLQIPDSQLPQYDFTVKLYDPKTQKSSSSSFNFSIQGTKITIAESPQKFKSIRLSKDFHAKSPSSESLNLGITTKSNTLDFIFMDLQEKQKVTKLLNHARKLLSIKSLNVQVINNDNNKSTNIPGTLIFEDQFILLRYSSQKIAIPIYQSGIQMSQENPDVLDIYIPESGTISIIQILSDKTTKQGIIQKFIDMKDTYYENIQQDPQNFVFELQEIPQNPSKPDFNNNNNNNKNTNKWDFLEERKKIEIEVKQRPLSRQNQHKYNDRHRLLKNKKRRCGLLPYMIIKEKPKVN
eukprot:Anaeramoba_ignava/a219313_84.p1 GENE.a219313_84~~a219313_84.p1  ORF type:complete len:1441 (+),score=484.24 a219313_84:43-4323(+)